MTENGNISEKIGLRLRRDRNRLDMSLRELARRIGANPNTISRLETGKQYITVDWLFRITKGLGLTIADIVEDTRYREQIVVKGRACPNLWTKECWYPPEKRYAIQVPPDARYLDIERFAVEGRCPAMNLRYPDGSLIICVHVNETDVNIRIDQYYLVERHRKQGTVDECELTIRKLVSGGDGKLWLVTESSEPEFQASIPFSGQQKNEVKPIALIIGSLQPE